MNKGCHYILNSKSCLLLLFTDLWLELFSVALKLWLKSWRRNVPNSQTWILAKPNFTSTRRTSDGERFFPMSRIFFCLVYQAKMTRLVLFVCFRNFIQPIENIWVLCEKVSSFSKTNKQRGKTGFSMPAFLVSHRFVINGFTSVAAIQLVYGLENLVPTPGSFSPLIITVQALYARLLRWTVNILRTQLL